MLIQTPPSTAEVRVGKTGQQFGLGSIQVHLRAGDRTDSWANLI